MKLYQLNLSNILLIVLLSNKIAINIELIAKLSLILVIFLISIKRKSIVSKKITLGKILVNMPHLKNLLQLKSLERISMMQLSKK